MTTATRQSGLSVRTRHGRAVNAVAEYLRSALAVPNIYLAPRNFAGGMMDVLAVDRAGAGDLHGVEIVGLEPKNLGPKTSLLLLVTHANRMNRIPAHYRYLAVPKTMAQLLPKLQLFSADGIGRTGILLFSEQQDGPPSVELAVKPERYRVSATDMAKVDRFLSQNRPDMEVRI